MGLFTPYKTIAIIEVQNGALVVIEPIRVSVDAKATLMGLAFLGVLLFFMGRWIYVNVDSSTGFILFIIIMYALALYSRSKELSSILNKRAFLNIDKMGISYEKSLYHWKTIDKIEFLKDKVNEGSDYIRLHLAYNGTKDIAYPENADPGFEQLARQLKQLETQFYV